MENRTHHARGRLYSLGRCLIRECWRSGWPADRGAADPVRAEHEVSCISARRIVATALQAGFTVQGHRPDAREAVGGCRRRALRRGRRRGAALSGRPGAPEIRLWGSATSARACHRTPWCSPSSTGPSVRTASCRVTSRRSACRTSAPAFSLPPSAWTRASPSRSCATTGSRWRTWRLVARSSWSIEVMEEAVEALGLPIFVKPANLGSSIGVAKASDPAALGDAVLLRLRVRRARDPRGVRRRVASSSSRCSATRTCG